MYAIIRTGGKQAKVREGDVIDVERLRAEGEITFTPLLFVGDDGTVISDRDGLKEVRVVGRILGGSTGPKIDIFKYKAKTGYRRRQGHRQKYTTVEVTSIEAPGVKRAEKAQPEKAQPEPAAEEQPVAEQASGAATEEQQTSKDTGRKAPSKASSAVSKTPAKPSSKAAAATKKTTTTKKTTSTAKKPASKKES